MSKYNYNEIAKDAVKRAQEFYLTVAPNASLPGASMQLGVVYYKYIAKVLEKALENSCPKTEYQSERLKLFSALEQTFGLYSGVLNTDLSIFGLSRINEALHDFSKESYHRIIDEWCDDAQEDFSDIFE